MMPSSASHCPGVDVELDEVLAALGERRSGVIGWCGRCFVDSAAPTIAWAAASRAIGTRNGEQLT